VAFTLETAADYYIFSPRLARLGTGQSFEVAFKPVRINEAPDERFGHAVEFWLFQSISPPADLDTDGFGVSLLWAGGGDWIVSSRKPVEGFTETGLHVRSISVTSGWPASHTGTTAPSNSSSGAAAC
jgi:hypothetical protein